MLMNLPKLVFSIADIKISLSSTPEFISYYIHTKFLDFIEKNDMDSPDYKIYVFPYQESLGLDDLFVDVPERYRTIDSYGIKGYVDVAQKIYMVHSPNNPNTAETILRIIVSDILINESGVMFHSSGVLDHDAAYMFSGKSGAGKSTMASLSLPRTILNDEMIAVRIINNQVMCYSTPFSGSGKTSHINISAPLKRLYLIQQNSYNNVLSCSESEAMVGIWKNIFSNRNDMSACKSAYYIVSEIAKRNLCKKLLFEKSESVWHTIYEDK